MSADDRTREVYERTTDSYVRTIGTSITDAVESASDIAALGALADRCLDSPVLDAGCGPGRAGRVVIGAGRTVVGLDLARTMVEVATASNDRLEGVQASLTDLPFRDQAFGGLVAWYSVIHLAPSRLAGVWAEFNRVLRPAAPLLVAFQAGDATEVDRDNAHGSGATLTSYHHDPDDIAAGLASAGLVGIEVSVRAPHHAHESTPQALISATVASGPGGSTTNRWR